MNINSIVVPIYNWKVKFLTNCTPNDEKSVINELVTSGVSDAAIDDAIITVKTFNAGVTLANNDLRTAIVIFSEVTSLDAFWTIIPHEMTHLMDRIAEFHALEYEGKAYLSGWIHNTLYKLGVFESVYSQTKVEYITTDLNKDNVYELNDEDNFPTAQNIDEINYDTVTNIDVIKAVKSMLVVYNGKYGIKSLKSRYNYTQEQIEEYLNKNSNETN